jgi:hypothetical protein
MKKVLLGWFVGLVVPVQKRFLFCLGCSIRPSKKIFSCRAGTRDICSAMVALRPSKNIFSSPYTISTFVPIDQQAGQADVLGRLSLVSLAPPFPDADPL